eukprot:CAMPEP_0117438540 /NCGR_PEP_ID=MMETSP0759-20121206/2105_1 /TAXON_ID=63605 /ORGANISM="Percolomonas cosmopolitus, Strain WS" /LENGTH=434 /DNA_ID=CAMNT_0005230233 /DNA_START=29 /DNA_END=1330 /DNA_ORIENTATION=-
MPSVRQSSLSPLPHPSAFNINQHFFPTFSHKSNDNDATDSSTQDATPSQSSAVNPQEFASMQFSINNVINQTWKSLLLQEKEKFGFNQDVVTSGLSDKVDSKQKLAILEKKIKREYSFFRQFLDSDLSREFFGLIFIYLGGLLRVERCRLELDTKSLGTEAVKDALKPKFSFIKKKETTQTKPNNLQVLRRRYNDARAESKDQLSRLSFVYSQILSQYRFPHDMKKETLFFETLYLFSYKIVIAKFPSHPSMHAVIRDELSSLFRTSIFHRSPHEKAQMKLTVKSNTLHFMNHKKIALPKPQLNVKLADSKVRSPLMDHSLKRPDMQKYNQIGNQKKRAKKKEGLNIPPHILFQNAAMENENAEGAKSSSTTIKGSSFNEAVINMTKKDVESSAAVKSSSTTIKGSSFNEAVINMTKKDVESSAAVKSSSTTIK